LGLKVELKFHKEVLDLVCLAQSREGRGQVGLAQLAGRRA
jgi:hypothetical protein